MRDACNVPYCSCALYVTLLVTFFGQLSSPRPSSDDKHSVSCIAHSLQCSLHLVR
ncbi:hypothetical protein J6590_011282 [Homalodisca vitripennis]|nr:hypothetical protein J6590_011282 [Homalodisca vitripennis]